jgi:hypothetical protein
MHRCRRLQGREVVLHLRGTECEAGQERASPSAVVAEGLGAALHVITVAGKAPRCADTPQTLERQRAGWRQKMSPRRCISPWIRCGMG